MFKKIFGFVVAVAMLAGCSMDVSYVAEVNESKIGNGIYKQIVAEKYLELYTQYLGKMQINILSGGENIEYKDFVKGANVKSVFEVNSEQDVAKNCLDSLDYYIRAAKLFDDSGMKLSKADVEELESTTDEMINGNRGDLYKNMNISRDDVLKYKELMKKSELVFIDKYKNEILTKYQDNFYSMVSIPYSFMKDTEVVMTDAEKAEVIAKASKHLEEIRAGKSISDKLYEKNLEEYQARLNVNVDTAGAKPQPTDYAKSISYIAKNSTQYKEITEFLSKTDFNNPELVETANACYIVQKAKIEDTPYNTMLKAYESISEGVERENFKKELREGDYGYTLNNGAVSVFSPSYIGKECDAWLKAIAEKQGQA